MRATKRKRDKNDPADITSDFIRHFIANKRAVWPIASTSLEKLNLMMDSIPDSISLVFTVFPRLVRMRPNQFRIRPKQFRGEVSDCKRPWNLLSLPKLHQSLGTSSMCSTQPNSTIRTLIRRLKIFALNSAPTPPIIRCYSTN